MVTVEYARARIMSAIDEIERLKHSEFPDDHSRQAICLLENLFRERSRVLSRITDTTDPEVANNECSVSLELLFVFVPIMGFVLRSTNVRNAFEAYSPLLRLAKSLMGVDTKLVVSSEWEFSPITYVSGTTLPGFVLIGLPATESSNPLIVPLAGHELGHSVWEVEGVGQKFEDRIRQGVVDELTGKRWADYTALYPQYKKDDIETNLFCRSTWEPAYTWSMLQAEEIFCDFFGLRLFAESYLHAFAYLLAPGTSSQRSVKYPNIRRRISHIVLAAKKLNVTVPSAFVNSFVVESEPTEPRTALLVSVADFASELLVEELLDEARSFADGHSIAQRDSARVTNIAGQFTKWVVPSASHEALVNILNAGWNCNLDPKLWLNVPQLKSEDRVRVLRDLMLKSMEVAEIQIRLGNAS